MENQHRPIERTKSRRLAAEFGWTRSSYTLLSIFLATIFLLAYVWWPLAEEYLEQIDVSQSLWRQIDWLLIGIFLAMSALIMAGADIRQDAWILVVGLAGGLVIESWGTQTELWTYYTLERPPLWMIPAWPIASLSIDRLVRISDRFVRNGDGSRWTVVSYWLVFPAFMGLMLFFVWPTIDKPLTIAALVLCAALILTPTNHRLAIVTFAAGAGLGFLLEYWGTTRLCWTYYTGQTPPVFAVFAHGMAAVAFWRTGLLLRQLAARRSITAPSRDGLWTNQL